MRIASGTSLLLCVILLMLTVVDGLSKSGTGVFYVQDECRKTNPFFINLYSHSAGTITLVSQSTNIYAGKYCTLFIRASGSYKLMVKIEKFDLAGTYGHCSSSPADTVRIYDAEKANSSSDHPLTRLTCGNMTGYPNVYSDTGIIQIEFFAHDNFGQHSGFRFVVSEVDNSHHEWPIYMQKVCNLTNPYRVTDKISGYLYSNNGPGLYYHGNMDCGVVITVDKGLTLGFIVQWMDIRMGSSCTDGGDYLRVYQGDSASGEALTQRMCGFRSKHVTTSTKTNQIFVRFHTSDGGVIQFSGFVLRFYIYTVTEETSSDPNIGAIIAGFAFCIAVIFFILLRVCKEPECRPKCRHDREGSRHRQVAPSRESRPQTYNQNRQTAEARNRSETRPVISSSFRAAPSSPSSTTITRSHSIPSGPDVGVASPTTPSTRTDTIPTAPTAPSSVTPRTVTRRPRPDSPPPSYQPQPYEPPPSYDSLFPNT